MKHRRDLLVLSVLFALLFVFVAFGPVQQSPTQPSRPTTYSTGPDGTQALLRWSQELGYDARRLEYRQFSLSADDAVLLVFNPSVAFNRTEAGEVVRWVEDGGTLILIDSDMGLFSSTDALLDELDLQTRPVSDTARIIERAAPTQPLFDRPPITSVTVRASRALATERDDYAALLGSANDPLLIGIQQGAGYVYAATTLYPFTNDGLRDADNAAFVLNVLQRFPANGRILFDEYHHGYFSPPSLRSIILGQPWGWGLLLAGAVVGLYLVLTGRRFGTPVPLRDEITLRNSAEYIESVADLFQRGGKRAYIGLHYYTALKRRLARPFGLNPRLDDAEFVCALGHYRSIDAVQLATILATLRQQGLKEETLVRTVALADSIATR